MSSNKVKIVLDTNSCRSAPADHKQFLGYKSELDRLATAAEIVIPSIVIDEISAQKNRALIKKKDEHLSNPFLFISGVDREQIKSISVENLVQQAKDAETINFTVRDITNKSAALAKIHDWSINKKPPFSASENGNDKGFKDAYIACTIEEILEECDDQYIVFMTKDELLSEKFRNNPRVKLIAEFHDAQNYIIDEFMDEYLREKIITELGMDEIDIVDSWVNIDENWVININKSGVSTLVIIDSQAREILDTYENSMDFFIHMFTDSGSFEQTHIAISELGLMTPYLRQKEMIDITQAAIANTQIAWISEDEDVRQFLIPIYKAVKELLDQDTRAAFIELYSV